MTKKELLLLMTLALVQFTNIMDFMVIMPLGPQLMELFKIGPKEFGFIVASYTYTAGIVNFLGIFFLDKFNRKKVLFLAYAGFCIGTTCCFLSPNYEILLLARIFTGVFGGLLSSSTFSILGDAIPIERRGTATGIVMISFSLASSLGVPFGLYLASKYTWNAPFLFLVIAGIFVLVLIGLFIPSMNSHLTKTKTNMIPQIMNILKNMNQLKALFLMAFIMFGQMSIIPFITPYLIANSGFTIPDLPFIYLFGGLSNFITMPLIGKLSDKFGFNRVFIFTVSLSCIPIFLLTNLPHVDLYVGLIVTTSFMILIGGRIVPTLALVTSTVHPQNRGSFMSFVSSIQQLFSGIATTISGLIVVKMSSGELANYNIVGYISILCALISIPLAMSLKSVEEKKEI